MVAMTTAGGKPRRATLWMRGAREGGNIVTGAARQKLPLARGVAAAVYRNPFESGNWSGGTLLAS